MLKPHSLLFAVFLVASSYCSAQVVIEKQSPAGKAGVLVQDVGLETLGGVFTPLLMRGCPLPCEATQIFSTADDNQSQIKLSLFRGSTKLTKTAHSLGHYEIVGIRPMARGQPQVAVTFSVSASAISILAIDKETAKPLEIKRREF